MKQSEYKTTDRVMREEWPEKKVLLNLSQGKESAFRYLFDEYYQLLVTFAYRYLGDLDSSRNIVQDIFVMLYEKRDEIKIHTSLKSHLYQSVRNRALNVIKREKMQREHHSRILDEYDGQGINDESWIVNELEGRIGRVVDGLPGQCQKIFRMSRQEGISNSDIAEQLSISKRTVETQISKALKRIRDDLKEHGYLSLLPLMAGIIDYFL